MIEVIALGGRTSFCEFPLWVKSGPRELPKQVCFEGETQPPLPQRTSRMGSPVNLVAENLLEKHVMKWRAPQGRNLFWSSSTSVLSLSTRRG